eukprot:COSAG05_NODE_522_length_9020_cov_18.531891_11_plen_49_part_00
MMITCISFTQAWSLNDDIIITSRQIYSNRSYTCTMYDCTRILGSYVFE